MQKQIPNILTYTRIFSIPFILIFMMYPEDVMISIIATAMFLLAGLTDFLDGYFARKYKSETIIGTLLDPIADKLLVSSVIVILVYQNKAMLIPSVAIICREIFVSGLREFLAGLKISVPVSSLAKIKTLIQFAALSMLILGEPYPWLQELNFLGNIILWVAALLTVFTGFIYFRASIIFIVQKES